MRRREFNVLVASGPAWGQSSPQSAAVGARRLWYRQPAQTWLQALPLGNGRLGAMVFGGVGEERIVLNDDTLYAEEPGQRDIPIDITRDFDRVVAMIRRGEYAEADEHITKHWLGRSWPCYQPLGELRLAFPPSGEASAYVRELNLDEAVAGVRFTQAGVAREREYFASHPADLLLVRLSASAAGALSFRLSLASPHPNVRTSAASPAEVSFAAQAPGIALRRTLEWVEKKGDQWKYPEIWNKDGTRRPFAKQILYGPEVNGRGMHFEVRVRVLATDGTASTDEQGLAVSSAREAVLAVAVATSFNGYDKSPSREGRDPASINRATLSRTASQSYKTFRQRHVTGYRSLFQRVQLELGEASRDNLPTDERISRHAKDRDPSLAALYFDFGRYLVISSSRPGTQPMNLQGLWNVDLIPPWAGAYTTNINLQMNYWPVEVANLSECHEPLFQFLREVSVTGARTASQMYHRPGWVLHHDTTIWRDAGPVDNEAFFSFWPMASGWLCRHLWERYRFTLDKSFLRDTAWPLLRGAAEFYSAWLADDGSGRLTTPVSTSPENRFRYADSKGRERAAGVAMGTTMDIAIIRELFAYAIEAARILGHDDALSIKLAAQLKLLPDYQVGSRGQILEYHKEFKDDGPHHDTSPFYPLYPGDEITRATPRLFEAERVLVRERHRPNGGWPGAWVACCHARLGDAERAHDAITGVVSRNHPNFFCGQGEIFQIDGNLGGVAAIAEMLLQSHDGEIQLLPALPKAWTSGNASGLRARGALTLDFSWRDSKLVSCSIKAAVAGRHRLRLPAGQKASNAAAQPDGAFLLELRAGQRKALRLG